MTRRVDEAGESGGILRQFHEKVADPPGNLANGAVYVLTPELADAIAAIDRDFIDLSTEILPDLMGRILVVETRGYHRDIGTPERLNALNRRLGQAPHQG